MQCIQLGDRMVRMVLLLLVGMCAATTVTSTSALHTEATSHSQESPTTAFGPFSPASWPPGELEKYAAANDVYNVPKTADGPLGKGVVSGTSSALAVHVASDVLRKGGNAVDAALAGSLAQVTIAAGAYVSFAGILSLLHFDASTGKTSNLNGCYNTVINERDARSIPKRGLEPKGRQVLVPGFMAGVEEALHTAGSGRFSLADIIGPALYFAEVGFPLSRLVAGNLVKNKALVTASDEGRRLFEKAPGVLYAAGDVFRQPELAQLLRNVSASGSKYMYTGDWGKRFVSAVAGRGGALTMDDMSKYRPVWTDPVATTVTLGADGVPATVYGPGEPGWGGVQFAETMNILEQMSGVVSPSTPHDKDGDALFWVVQALRWSQFVQMINATVPSIMALAFPELVNINSDVTRTSPALAAKVWALMSATNGTEDIKARLKKYYFRGNGVSMRNVAGDDTQQHGVGKHSDGFLVVDSNGDACSLVHSINTQPWGTGIFVDGVALPDSAAIQQWAVNHTLPGGRLSDPTGPAIVTTASSGGVASGAAADVPSRVLALTSAVGGGLLEVAVQGVLAMLRYGRTAGEAGTTGKVQAIEYSGSVYPTNQSAEVGQFQEAILQRVRLLGQSIHEHTNTAGDSTGDKGYWVGVRAPNDASKGTWSAFAASELNGLAEVVAD